MVSKKSRSKVAAAATPPTRRNLHALEVAGSNDTTSQKIAKLVTMSATSAITLQSYSGGGADLESRDLIVEMEKAGDEVVAGELCRVERMLANQLMTLDAIFNNMAQRSFRQDSLKGIEVLMRLALKAQGQCRATAETLAVIKNPMPYIRQANIAGGHQQVNNGARAERYAEPHSPARNSQIEPNKLLEAHHEQRLDIGTQAAAGRDGQTVEAVDQVHRAEDA